jgi:hypothetical protein
MSHIHNTNSDAQKEREETRHLKKHVHHVTIYYESERAGVMGNGKPQHTKID